MHLAQISVEDYVIDEDRIGWLRVIYKGEVRMAMPKMRFGSFEMPSKEWVDKYGSMLGVWIVGQTTPDERYSESFLVWDGFTFLKGKVPEDALQDFPYARLYFTENWSMLFSDMADKNRFVIKHTDGTLFMIDRTKDSECFTFGDGKLNHNVLLDKDGVTLMEGASGNTIVMDKDGGVTVNAIGDVKVVAGGDVYVEASGNATVKGTKVTLNMGGGKILTDLTATPACLFTGKPFAGVPTCEAG
jgi:hypothetical protein